MKRIIISGGGTGGHIFPAIAIADTITKRYPEAQILFVGAEGRMEMERVPRAGYEIVGLPIKGLDRKHLLKNFKVGIDMLRSLSLASNTIRRFKPEVVVGVGGYASAPTLKAAQMLGIPTLIQEQNSYAGVTNKFLSKKVKRICVAYPEMERFFPADKIILTGNPIRPEIEILQGNRQEALQYFGLSQDSSKILLVIGGSLGARTINLAIARALPSITQAGVTLIWQTGKEYIQQMRKEVAAVSGLKVYISDFIDRMDHAYTLADLVVSRAGASSVSELCLLGKASILVPSPNVAEDHQTKNAKALSSRNAAVLITDKEAPELLGKTALDLLADAEQLSRLSESALSLAHRKAADRIVDEIERVLLIQNKPEQKNLPNVSK